MRQRAPGRAREATGRQSRWALVAATGHASRRHRPCSPLRLPRLALVACGGSGGAGPPPDAVGLAHDAQGHGVQHRVRRHPGELRQGRRGREEGAAGRHRSRGGRDQHRPAGEGRRLPVLEQRDAGRLALPAARAAGGQGRLPLRAGAAGRAASRSPTCTCRPTTRGRRRSAAARPSRRSLATEEKVRLPYIQTELEVLPPLAEQGIPTFLVGDFNAPSWRDYTAGRGRHARLREVRGGVAGEQGRGGGRLHRLVARRVPRPAREPRADVVGGASQGGRVEPGPERAAGPHRLHLLGRAGEGDGRAARRRAGRPGSDLRGRAVAVAITAAS